ncbi:MAG TPA: hypothetical protein DCQ98_17580 [Planctomycetaceae bacterium]|nr:hypothetical protein [Planctomycetaceae bacterium]HRE99579.1 hypothetical protein [Pirellulaceae bacterium]
MRLRKRIPALTVHIGTEKTGTTTIQELLFANRQRLAERRIGVLVSPGQANNRGAATYCMAAGRIDDHGVSNGLRDPGRRERWRSKLRKGLIRELRGMVGRIDRVILTSEHFHSRLVDESEVRTLLELVGPYFDRIDILVYLRRQDRLATSSYSTLLTSGGKREEILPSGTSDRTHFFDYLALVERWSSVFGRDRLTIRPFDKRQWIEGRLVDDFLHHAGIAVAPSELTLPPNRNESVSAHARPILLRFNRHFPSVLETGPNPHSAKLRWFLVRRLRDAYPGPPQLPARDEARAFAELFRARNRELAEKYLDGRPLFDDDFSDYPEQSEAMPIEPVAVDLIAETMAEYLKSLG